MPDGRRHTSVPPSAMGISGAECGTQFCSNWQASQCLSGKRATTQHRRGARQEGVQRPSCSPAAQRGVRTCPPQQRDLCTLVQLGSGEEGHKPVQHRLIAPAPGSREGRRHTTTDPVRQEAGRAGDTQSLSQSASARRVPGKPARTGPAPPACRATLERASRHVLA